MAANASLCFTAILAALLQNYVQETAVGDNGYTLCFNQFGSSDIFNTKN